MNTADTIFLLSLCLVVLSVIAKLLLTSLLVKERRVENNDAWTIWFAPTNRLIEADKLKVRSSRLQKFDKAINAGTWVGFFGFLGSLVAIFVLKNPIRI